MKKIAVLIYEQFCNFEICVALEMLAMAFGRAIGKVKIQMKNVNFIICGNEQLNSSCSTNKNNGGFFFGRYNDRN